MTTPDAYGMSEASVVVDEKAVGDLALAWLFFWFVLVVLVVEVTETIDSLRI